MDINTNPILQKIESCRNLLKLFQKERNLFLSKKELTTADIMPMLKMKKQLIDIIDNSNSTTIPVQQADNKKLLLELGSILEELLVIDRENELLLKTLLKKNEDKSINKTKKYPIVSRSINKNMPTTNNAQRNASLARRAMANAKLNNLNHNNKKYI